MQPDRVIQFQQLFGFDADSRAGFIVVIAPERDNRIDAVIPACHLQHDENGRVLAGCDLRVLIDGLGLQCGESVGEKRRHRPGKGAGQNRAAKELAPGLESDFVFHNYVTWYSGVHITSRMASRMSLSSKVVLVSRYCRRACSCLPVRLACSNLFSRAAINFSLSVRSSSVRIFSTSTPPARMLRMRF